MGAESTQQDSYLKDVSPSLLTCVCVPAAPAILELPVREDRQERSSKRGEVRQEQEERNIKTGSASRDRSNKREARREEHVAREEQQERISKRGAARQEIKDSDLPRA